jgi:hypothetical protein
MFLTVPLKMLGFPAWAYAFAGLFVYLAGLAVCYAILAFAFLTIDPTEFDPVGRGILIVLGLAWTVLLHPRRERQWPRGGMTAPRRSRPSKADQAPTSSTASPTRRRSLVSTGAPECRGLPEAQRLPHHEEPRDLLRGGQVLSESKTSFPFADIRPMQKFHGPAPGCASAVATTSTSSPTASGSGS